MTDNIVTIYHLPRQRQRQNPDEMVGSVKDLVNNWMRNEYPIIFAGSNGESKNEKKRYADQFRYDCKSNNYTLYQTSKLINTNLWRNSDRILFHTHSALSVIRTYARRYPFLHIIYFKDP